MLARFPDPQPKFVQAPERDWWLIAIRVALGFVLLVIAYMASVSYLGFDPLHLVQSKSEAFHVL